MQKKKETLIFKILFILLIILVIAIIPIVWQNPETTEQVINLSGPQQISYDLMWEKKIGAEIIYADISSNGKIIAIISGIWGSGYANTETFILNEAGAPIWQTDNPTISTMGLSPDGSCLAMPGGGKDNDLIYFYPNSLPTHKAGSMGGSKSLYVTSNCESILVYKLPKIILRNREGNELWSFQTGETRNLKRISMSNNGNYIQASFSERVILGNKNGILWEKKMKDLITSSISPNGNYIVAVSVNHAADIIQTVHILNNRGIALNSYQINLPRFIEIRDIFVTDSGIEAVYATDFSKKQKSTVLLINNNGSLLWKKDFNDQITAMAVSDLGSHVIIGTDKGNLYYFVGPEVGIPIELEQEIVTENPINPILIAAGFMAFGIISVFVALPYYKRAKLKKQMAKTPTDWCPHCKKFTGGTAICPHCGKETLVETKYDTSKKVKKK